MDNKKQYGPSMRNYLDAPMNNKMSFSKDGENYNVLQDEVTNSIITNNISSSELDYTYDNSDHEQF